MNAIIRTQYKKMYNEFEMKYEEERGIVLLGDSIINYFKEEQYFSNKNIINRGIPGDDTKGVLNRLHQIIKLNPKIIILSIGSNDIPKFKDSSDEIVKRILKIKYTLEEKLLDTKVYIISILPVLDDKEITNYNYLSNRNNDIIDEINEELMVFTNIIDVSGCLKDKNNNLKKEYTYDGVHLNEKGYIPFSRELSQNISELILKKEFEKNE